MQRLQGLVAEHAMTKLALEKVDDNQKTQDNTCNLLRTIPHIPKYAHELQGMHSACVVENATIEAKRVAERATQKF
eukprot:5722445-Amphidinium_carterae.1